MDPIRSRGSEEVLEGWACGYEVEEAGVAWLLPGVGAIGSRGRSGNTDEGSGPVGESLRLPRLDVICLPV